MSILKIIYTDRKTNKWIREQNKAQGILETENKGEWSWQDTLAAEQGTVGAHQSITGRHMGTNGIEGTREKHRETSYKNTEGQSIGIN